MHLNEEKLNEGFFCAAFRLLKENSKSPFLFVIKSLYQETAGAVYLAK